MFQTFLAETTMTITKDYLAGLDDEDSYTGLEITLPCDDLSATTRRFDVYDDDDEHYYRVVIQHCDEVAAEAAFEFFMRDSGATYMKDITGDNTDWSMA